MTTGDTSVIVPGDALPIFVEDVDGGVALNADEHAMVCALMCGCNITEAIASTGVATATHYNRMRRNPYYAALVDYAWEVVHDTLFSLVVERAKAGDNRLLLEALKHVAGMRGKLSPSRVELTGAGGGPLQVQSDVHEERVVKLHQELKCLVSKDAESEALGWA
jgi:hypothetical protein